MTNGKKVKDLMTPLKDYPHIPVWFTLKQAMATLREMVIKFKGPFQPRALLVFGESYQLLGLLTWRDIVRGLSPTFPQEACLSRMSLQDFFGPTLEEKSQRPVSEVLVPIRFTIDGNAPIVQALHLMIQENVSRIPVVEADRVIGIIRLSDLFNEIAKVVLGEESCPSGAATEPK